MNNVRVVGRSKSGSIIMKEDICVPGDLSSSDVARCLFRDDRNLASLNVVRLSTRASFHFSRKDLPAVDLPGSVQVMNRFSSFIFKLLGFKKEFHKI